MNTPRQNVSVDGLVGGNASRVVQIHVTTATTKYLPTSSPSVDFKTSLNSLFCKETQFTGWGVYSDTQTLNALVCVLLLRRSIKNRFIE